MAYKIVNDDSLTSVANAIRVKAEISGTLEFPDGFVSAIQNLSPSGNDALVITLTDSAAVSETYGFHWTPDCSYNDYYEAVIQQRPIGLKVNRTICGDAFARRGDNSPNWFQYVIVEEVTDANDNAIGLVHKYYQLNYSGVTLTDEFFTPYPWDGTAVASDVASGKIFYSSNGREVGTATPSSGVDMPVFSATWAPHDTPSGAITCNKTFNQCYSLMQSDHMYAAVIMNSFTYPNDPSTYPLYGSYVYIDGQACILYRNYDASNRSIKYASDGTISVFDATDY